jgi:hypothetical protein
MPKKLLVAGAVAQCLGALLTLWIDPATVWHIAPLQSDQVSQRYQMSTGTDGQYLGWQGQERDTAAPDDVTTSLNLSSKRVHPRLPIYDRNVRRPYAMELSMH